MKDLSHVLEFLCHVKYVQVCWFISKQYMMSNNLFQYFYLKIVGTPENVGTSNIKTQFLSFDVSFFKSVEELEVYFQISFE